MHKTLIILAVTASVLVGAYFVYDYFRPKCGEIFEQTALNVRAKAEIVKTKGELFIGREKIQELTSSSQKALAHLKTCCIVLEGGKLNPDQFQRCIETVQNYEKKLTKVVASLDEAQTAKQQNNPDLVKSKVEEINKDLNAANAFSEELEKQVADIPIPGTPESKPDSNVTPATSKEGPWEIIPNPKLKSMGRVVVSLPKDVMAGVEIFEAGRKERLTDWYGSRASDLVPGPIRRQNFGGDRRFRACATGHGHPCPYRCI